MDNLNKPSLYQLLIYDGSHIVSSEVAFLNPEDLKAAVLKVEQTHTCCIQPLKFYSMNIYDSESHQLNIDPIVKLMTEIEVSELRSGSLFDLPIDRYRYELRELSTGFIDSSSPK